MSNRRYAIICAPHEGNAGMRSVDQAAEDFFSLHDVDYSLFSAQRKNHRMRGYRSFDDWDDVKQFSHIVYWGDFLNNPFYGYKSFPERSRRWGLGESRREALSRWKTLFNPANPGDKKLFAVGQNFQQYFGDKKIDFGAVFHRLENSFEALVVRDSFSFQNLSRALDFSMLSKVKQGLDCAFLQSERLSGKRGNGTFVYYFRRSKLSNPKDLVRRIEASTGLRGVELESWIPLPRGNWDGRFHELKTMIDNAELVVSDTYHVCVNAMQSRTPTVSLGRKAERQIGTIGEFKKRVLFDMFDLSRFYHEMSESQPDLEVYEAIVDAAGRFLDESEADLDPYYLVNARTREFAGEMERILELDG